MHNFNWTDLRFFLDLVRADNYQDAARRLSVDHSTVRRRVASLEEALNVRLFVAHEQPLELTPKGAEMLAYAEEIESLAMRASEDVKGADSILSGTVRIGVLDGFSSSFITPRLKLLLDRHPALNIELAVFSRIFNLSKREADIAIAPEPPSQRRQLGRKLTDVRLCLYASKAYLSAKPIDRLSDLAHHRLITYVPELVFSPEMNFLNFVDNNFRSTLEATNVIAQLSAVEAGIGVGVLPHFMTAHIPELVRVLPEDFSLTREYWLVRHPDSSNMARVEAVSQFVIEQVDASQHLFLD